MGFDDKDIVALSGAHTLGSCHRLRSGFDGPWTHNPLKFDNEYFKNLLELEWTVRGMGWSITVSGSIRKTDDATNVSHMAVFVLAEFSSMVQNSNH
jgi:hypothetical protein